MKHLLLSLGLCVATPAAANWQYTHWDMLPSEVSAASNGSAVTISAAESHYQTSPGSGLRPLLKAPYVSGRFNFDAYFYFETGTNRLKKVTLNLVEPADNPILIGSLKQKYGAPLEDRSTNEPIKLVVLVWQTSSDQVVYSQIGDSSGSIEYVARQNANTSGL